METLHSVIGTHEQTPGRVLNPQVVSGGEVLVVDIKRDAWEPSN